MADAEGQIAITVEHSSNKVNSQQFNKQSLSSSAASQSLTWHEMTDSVQILVVVLKGLPKLLQSKGQMACEYNTAQMPCYTADILTSVLKKRNFRKMFTLTASFKICKCSETWHLKKKTRTLCAAVKDFYFQYPNLIYLPSQAPKSNTIKTLLF